MDGIPDDNGREVIMERFTVDDYDYMTSLKPIEREKVALSSDYCREYVRDHRRKYGHLLKESYDTNLHHGNVSKRLSAPCVPDDDIFEFHMGAFR